MPTIAKYTRLNIARIAHQRNDRIAGSWIFGTLLAATKWNYFLLIMITCHPPNISKVSAGGGGDGMGVSGGGGPLELTWLAAGTDELAGGPVSIENCRKSSCPFSGVLIMIRLQQITCAEWFRKEARCPRCGRC